MYTKRIQLINYGPVEKLDIEFPFKGQTPKPVVIVGTNGSGKSILISHIVNGLLSAKGIAFPETPEVEVGKVYKLRSNLYIRPGSEFYFGRVDFDGGFFVSEIRTRRIKQDYPDVPTGISETVAETMWNLVDPEENDHFDSNVSPEPSTTKKIKEILGKHTVLYFPFNRFEEPAWLNEENLKAEAQYMDRKHLTGYTGRKIIASSPLHDNKNWLFDLIYDRAAFELQTHQVNLPVDDSDATIPLPLFSGYSGDAARTYETVLEIVRKIMRRPNIRFGIGRRNNRAVSVMSGEGMFSSQLVPNIFQLSSGETSLLNLFLSILRDFDLCGTSSSQPADVRGIVVVDEIDLHLHAVHQYEVLPELIKVFPNVQFVVTTHSPLFILGMHRVLGEDGFGLYRLPHGHRISPEEFSEFGDAYRAFTETVRFSDDMRAAIQGVQKPIVYVEGSTGQKYIHRAAQLLSQETILEGVELRDGGGTGDLKNIWRSWLPDIVPQKVILLFDCEEQLRPADKGNLLRRTIPLQSNNPIQKGVENLFSKETLERARKYKPAFIDVDPERTRIVRGEPQTVPEIWTINSDEKTNLCDWLCQNGTREDFQCFEFIFQLLNDDLLDVQSAPQEETALGELGDSESAQDESAPPTPKESS